MPQMISKMDHHYDGKRLKAGQPFEALDEFVYLLETLGHAVRMPPPAVYQTRVMRPSKRRAPE